jgi:hypothetical protein
MWGMAMTGEEFDGTVQQPLVRHAVLTEFGVELEPTGTYPLAQQFAKAVRDYRRRCTIVSETQLQRKYPGGRP